MTSKAEMMSRPNSAKARVDYNSQSPTPTGPSPLVGGVVNRTTSPPAVSVITIIEPLMGLGQGGNWP